MSSLAEPENGCVKVKVSVTRTWISQGQHNRKLDMSRSAQPEVGYIKVSTTGSWIYQGQHNRKLDISMSAQPEVECVQVAEPEVGCDTYLKPASIRPSLAMIQDI